MTGLEALLDLFNEANRFNNEPYRFNTLDLFERKEIIEKDLQALEIIKKYFIIKFDVETELSGNVWGRLVHIQSKEDEGECDTTASANLADYKEDFEVLKEVLGNE